MAAIAAGEDLTAAALNALVNNTLIASEHAATTSPTMGTVADLPGAAVTFTTTTANVQCLVIGTFDVSQGAVGDVFVGSCMVDGVGLSGGVNLNGLRDTSSGFWIPVLAAAGSHTIKLRGAVTAGTDTNTNSGNTKLIVIRLAA